MEALELWLKSNTKLYMCFWSHFQRSTLILCRIKMFKREIVGEKDTHLFP
jgi:hypothetical protein